MSLLVDIISPIKKIFKGVFWFIFEGHSDIICGSENSWQYIKEGEPDAAHTP
jgi:hypothetical protein